jgi:hypothetical protein
MPKAYVIRFGNLDILNYILKFPFSDSKMTNEAATVILARRKPMIGILQIIRFRPTTSKGFSFSHTDLLEFKVKPPSYRYIWPLVQSLLNNS